MGVNSLPKTVTRQRRGCDLNPGPSAPESSTLTTQLPSHPHEYLRGYVCVSVCPRAHRPIYKIYFDNLMIILRYRQTYDRLTADV